MSLKDGKSIESENENVQEKDDKSMNIEKVVQQETKSNLENKSLETKEKNINVDKKCAKNSNEYNEDKRNKNLQIREDIGLVQCPNIDKLNTQSAKKEMSLHCMSPIFEENKSPSSRQLFEMPKPNIPLPIVDPKNNTSINSLSGLMSCQSQKTLSPENISNLNNLNNFLLPPSPVFPGVPKASLPIRDSPNNNILDISTPTSITTPLITTTTSDMSNNVGEKRKIGITRQSRCQEEEDLEKDKSLNNSREVILSPSEAANCSPYSNKMPRLINKSIEPLQRARSLTLPNSKDDHSSKEKDSRPSVIYEESGTNTGKSTITSPKRIASLDNCMMMTIPTFTVTINPMEDDEITFVPDSPTQSPPHNNKNKKKVPFEGLRPDDNGNNSSNSLKNNGCLDPHSVVVHMAPPLDEDDIRRSSIGSASSLAMDPEERNLLGVRDLQIRRVSEISHIQELRQVSGMEHLASEYYEISREPNPDAISLDSIHKTIFKRCRNKYMPPERSSTQNKCFVIITSGFTILGIIYGFWYKNFGPGADSH